MNFLVSIITPAFNCSDTILATYNSINRQCHSNWEWLVTDDCSNDSTNRILTEISRLDKRVFVFKNNINSGAASSRNHSLMNSTGEFIAFIDSDDLWIENKLSIQINYMLSNNINFSFTAYELISKNSELIGCKVDNKHRFPISYEDMLRKKATVGCSTVMLRKSGFGNIKMPLLRTGQDYALWLQLLKTGAKAYPINNVLTQYRILPNSISRNKFKKAKRQWQIYRTLEGLGLLKSIECFCFYAWRAVFRK